MVPKIRFKEFTANWKDQVLKDVCSVIMDGTHFSPKSKDGPKKYITSKNIRNEGMLLDDVAYISEEEHRAIYKKCPVQHGDVLLTKDGANTGNCCLNSLKEEFSLLSSVAVIRGKENSLKNSYLLQVLQSKKGQSKINDHIAGQAITRITLKKINEFSFSIPALDEQTKISDFMSSVDEKITLLNQQYDLLCQYKNGMMQEIFSQKMRFKDDSGRAFPEWKSTILDEVVDLITNGLALDQNDSKNGYPVSRIETISERCINMKKVGFVDTDNDISNYKLNYGDMLFSNINSISHIGKIAYFDIDDTLYHGMNLLRIVIKNSHCKLFFYYQLTTDTNKKYFESRANQAVSQASINQTELRKTPVQVPCKEEQTKIANFLSALDDKIVVKKAELDKLKTWKQGLLQQMFV